MTQEGIKKILQALEESLRELHSLSTLSKKEFTKNRVFQDVAKWNFYVVIQSCLDLGNHIISAKGWQIPETYEDIVTILDKQKVISKNIVSSLRGMGGFRNLLAHGYFKIDEQKLFGYLKKLGDIDRYIKQIRQFLDL